METAFQKPRIGISACLLGQKVRHNGEDKRNDWLVDVLSNYVTWVPLCPEVEMGLGVPRKTMRLTGKPDQPQLIVKGTEENLTDLALQTAKRLIHSGLKLDSYIFKKDSPSCGMERVKIYGKNNSPSRSAVGLFAKHVITEYPEMPMIEEGRLTDPAQQELYLVRLFAWMRLKNCPQQVSQIQAFHQAYKLLLMAHAPNRYQALGKIASNSERKKPSEVFTEYSAGFLQAIRRPPTRKQWMNVLQHMFGYFKDQLPPKEKQQILATLEEYRREELPLIAPLTLLKHLTEKYEVSYLTGQLAFQPFPKGLMPYAR